MTKVDVVICSIDSAKFQNVSQSLREWGDVEIESITRIGDAKSMCEGYNRGAYKTSAEWVLFCHDDIEIVLSSAVDTAAAFSNLDVFGVCGTQRLRGTDWYDSEANLLQGSVLAPDGSNGHIEHQIFGTADAQFVDAQALDGVFIMCRRTVWEELKFDEQIPGFTCYDLDFTYRSHLAGFRVGILPSLILYHASHPQEFSAQKVQGWRKTRELLGKKFFLSERGEGYVKHDIVKYISVEHFCQQYYKYKYVDRYKT